MEEANLKYVILQVIVCSFGVVGNLIVISIIFILKEHQKSATHWYVLNLALADTLFLITLPLRAYETTQNGIWFLPESLCKAKEVVLFLNYYSSVLFLGIMSIDRYIAVCHPFSKPLQKLRKPFSALIIALLVWILSLILCIPVLLSVFTIKTGSFCKCQYDFNVLAQERCQYKIRCGQSAESSKKPNYCPNVTTNDYYNLNGEGSFDLLEIFDNGSFPKPDLFSNNYNFDEDVDFYNVAGAIEPNCDYFLDPLGFRVFLTFNFAAMFLIPLLIMVVCYGLIVNRVSKTNLTNKQISSRNTTKKKRVNSSSENNKKRVTVMCATLVSSFIVCWLPYHAVHLAKIVGIDQTASVVCEILGRLGSLLGFLNSALNPYLYSFIGTNSARRWKSATQTLRDSIRGRRISASSLAPKSNIRKRSQESTYRNSFFKKSQN